MKNDLLESSTTLLENLLGFPLQGSLEEKTKALEGFSTSDETLAIYTAFQRTKSQGASLLFIPFDTAKWLISNVFERDLPVLRKLDQIEIASLKELGHLLTENAINDNAKFNKPIFFPSFGSHEAETIYRSLQPEKEIQIKFLHTSESANYQFFLTLILGATNE